ncbi:hypothetical protein MPTK1_1g26120 [Marchantia polymorpha subsp. ruderalis]|uniref:EF-hand domain-containing protein n=2 Tax=Marchantia polymorpha TaxID=3197 RepID=A0AAF6AUE8_MARPO|nr:hypothetical protein MARPO_0002s0265 [Marchantia polymorpha]BBN00069.1 hypothetical protein Mp_1g26120 [Marchantia polymorpha subsp. ruderalis]|eukprot:PTQ49815.1 hypothetical protein MARPO_0002s0265 [Marchantia polymorpha]
MATIFGMTYFGDPETLLHAQRRPVSVTLKDVPKNKYIDLFRQKGRKHLNEDSLRRALLPEIFTDAVGRLLSPAEYDLMLRFFPVDPGNISFEEFSKTIDDMKADRAVSPPPIITKVAKTLVGKPPPKKKVLNSQLKEMKFKHRRDPLGPTDAYQRPLTQNMEYGWDTMVYPGESAVPVHERKRHFPKGQTDVTAGGEGLTLETYYGVEYIRI